MKYHLILVLGACNIASSITASVPAEAALSIKLNQMNKADRIKSKDANLIKYQHRVFRDKKIRVRTRALSDARRQKARAKYSY